MTYALSVRTAPRCTSGTLAIVYVRQMFGLAAASNGISMSREDPLRYCNITMSNRTPSKPMQTSFNHFYQFSSFDKDMLEHVELRVPQFEHSLQRLQNLPRTGQGMLFNGFPWLSAWWHCSSSWSALVPPTFASGSFTSEDVSGATELTLSSSL